MKNFYGPLLRPINIGSIELKNRVTMSPMDFKFVYGNYPDSTLTERLANVYKARAKGGAALIFTSHIKAEQKLDPFPKSLTFPIIDRDERIKEFAEIADAVHLYGTKIAAELSPGSGRYADYIVDEEVVSASAVPTQYDHNIITRPLKREEIAYLVDCYGKAAGRLKAAGFDAICIHASCGYLIGQFLSPAWNHRTDEYGGSPQKRMRFLIECIESAKRNVGDDFPLLLSLTVDEKLSNINLGTLTTGKTIDDSHSMPAFSDGITVDYAIEVAQTLEHKGYVDAYHVRIGNYYDQEHIIPSAYSTNEEYREAIIAFKAGVTKPVIFDNKLSDPAQMQQMIEQGETDLVSMGRGWIAEPEWVKKAEKDVSEIRPCIRCMMCLETLWQGKYCQCAVNPRFGHEGELILPAAASKNVLVIGGGPGGMTAALTAAQRGHKVSLIEKSDHLGGRLFEAGSSAFKTEILAFCRWLVRQVEASEVNLHLGIKANSEYILTKSPDAVIVATGSDPIILNVPGGEKAILAEDVLLERKATANNVVIVGGGMVGCEAAYKLREQGKDVTIVEMRPDILMDTSVVYRHAAVRKIKDTGAKIITNAVLSEIDEKAVVLNDQTVVPCDNVVWAVGFKPDNSLYQALYDKLDEAYLIGDGKGARKVFNAVQEGYRIASEL